MGNRVDTLFRRLERLVPPPDAVGWHFTRLKIEAEAMGGNLSFDETVVPSQDDQAASAEDQLRLGAVLERVDAGAGTWDVADAVDWRLSPVLEQGSSGFFLDVWGRALAVPRMEGEVDSTYAQRIVADVSRSTTTNIGLAEAIDVALGVTGTRVLDASAVFNILRFNAGNRMNSGLKFNNSRADSLWCCFVVQIGEGMDESALSRLDGLVNSRKAAGTRLIGILTGNVTSPIITAPTTVPSGATFQASLQGRPLASGHIWTVIGGTILSGQGASMIEVEAGPTGTMEVKLSVVEDALRTPDGRKFVTVAPAIGSGIVCGVTYAYAGDGPLTASLPVGYTYAWTVAGGYAIDGESTQLLTFSLGEANQLATVQCVASAPGFESTFTHDIKIVPYTSSISVSTPSLATNEESLLELPLGWEWALESVTVNRPAWVRIYNTESARTVDSGRLITDEPHESMVDLVWEGIFTDLLLTIASDPDVLGVNGDTPRSMLSYLSVRSLDTASGIVSVTINRTETRTSGIF